MDKRSFIKSIALLGGASFLSTKVTLAGIVSEEQKPSETGFFLLPLPYAYNALEPYIDAQTMEIHHKKHHQSYIDKLNAAVKGTDAEGKTLDDIIANISRYQEAVRNNAGGHFNHSLFWTILGPKAGGKPTGRLAEVINTNYKSFENFKTEFNKAAMSRFGSGWAWLIARGGNIAITSTPNQDNPYMDVADNKGTPILGLDVWEHAYYLKYQNRRQEYIDAFWNVVNWEAVSKRFETAR